MVDRKRVLATLGAVSMLWAAGCSEKNAGMAITQEDSAQRRAEHHTYTQSMRDNVLVLDSSIVDTCFVPHAADLSGLGIDRITRMGEAFGSIGGTIRYRTSLRDEELVDARLASVREFLAASGFDTDIITVEAGLARSAGMTAAESIERRNAGFSGGDDAGAPPAMMPAGAQ